MMTSHPGVAGALGGLALGAMEYVIALGVMRRVVAREIAEGGDFPGLQRARSRVRNIKLALAGCAFLLFPALGFTLGSTLGSETGSTP